jgi:hypothetical protein
VPRRNAREASAASFHVLSTRMGSHLPRPSTAVRRRAENDSNGELMRNLGRYATPSRIAALPPPLSEYILDRGQPVSDSKIRPVPPGADQGLDCRLTTQERDRHAVRCRLTEAWVRAPNNKS